MSYVWEEGMSCRYCGGQHQDPVEYWWDCPVEREGSTLGVKPDVSWRKGLSSERKEKAGAYSGGKD